MTDSGPCPICGQEVARVLLAGHLEGHKRAVNRADRRAAAKKQRRCRPHYWVSKSDYPERGTWCLECGKRKDEQ